MKFGSSLLALAVLLPATGAGAFDFYVRRIPNGAENECLNCHRSAAGGDARNPFGSAFEASGADWAAVCDLDSDNDDQTNGQELGDPDCVWTSGAAARTTDISLPGDNTSTSADPTGGAGAGGGGEGEGEGDAGGEGEGEGGGDEEGGGCASAGLGLPVALLALVARRRRA